MRANYNTNVFEAGIGEDDDVVQPDRSGMLILSTNKEAIDAIARKRARLASYSVTGWSFQSEGKSQKTVIFATFDVVDMSGHRIGFKNSVIRDGKLAEKEPTQMTLTAENDRDVDDIVKILAADINEKLSNSGVPIAHLERLSGPKAIHHRISEALSADYQAANERIRARIKAIKDSPEFQEAANRAYYESIREQLQRAIRGYQGITSEELHRMIDEISCASVHEI